MQELILRKYSNVSELSEKLNHLKSLYQEICAGFSEFNYSGEPIFIKHFTEIEIGFLHSRKDEYLKEAVAKGLEFREDKLIYLTRQEIWERSKDIELENLQKEISDLNMVLKNLAVKSQINKTKEKIKTAQNKLNAIEREKKDVLGFCVEDYLEKKFTEDFIFNCFYKDRELKRKLFESSNLGDISYDEFEQINNYIGNLYKKLSNDEIKRIAASSFIMNIFGLCNDNAYYFYGDFVKNLTSFQVNLFSQCRYFKHLMSSKAEASPPDDVAEDPDKMIEWYDMLSASSSKSNVDDDSALGIGHTGADRGELEKMAGGTAKTLGEIAKEKGNKLTKEDFLKLHGI